MILFYLGLIVLGAPALLLAILGLSTLWRIRLSESTTTKLTQFVVFVGAVSSIAVLVGMLAFDTRHVTISKGDWVSINSAHFHFTIKFVFDRLSIPFVIMSYLLCGVIGAFASRYMHLESGFNRFFILYAIFLLGIVVSSTAGTIETLFMGWELVGLSSALLVAFFHNRINPVRNGLRIWIVYRIADAAFYTAALALHHLSGHGDFDHLMGLGDWPNSVSMLSEQHAFFVGFLLLIATAGKSALIPFSGWLPRAMEGPTPSSAIFYGALSVHLGAFLLLRVSPIIVQSLALQIIIIALGAATAILATVMSRVQADVKSRLAFASLTQVSLIIIEIGIGWCYIPLIHIIGHACLRTLQLVRAPSLLRDYNSLVNALGQSSADASANSSSSSALNRNLYRLAYERGFLDTAIDQCIVAPFQFVFESLILIESRWLAVVNNQSKRNGDVKPNPTDKEEKNAHI